MPSKSAANKKLSEQQRARRRAEERELMARAVEELKSSEGWQRWLSLRRRFRTYSLHNQLLIAMQCPHATKVAGFRRWLEIGYAVRKGEKAIRIWAPCPPSAKRLREWREAGADPATEPKTFFRLVAVFDRSQVSPLPEFPGGPVDLDPPPDQPIEGDALAYLLEPLRRFGASIGYSVAVEEIRGGAEGRCDHEEGRITVLPVSKRFSPNAQVAVTIHELSHALVRREPREDDPRLTYSEGEVVAECVAYSVCAAAGLDTSSASVPYVTGWSRGGEIERYAALIDRLASRLEDIVLPIRVGTELAAA